MSRQDQRGLVAHDPTGERPTIAAVLVVRDEARLLSGCLESLTGFVDEIVVHDTGSVDDTVAIARAAGAAVHQGFWDDDFARARNVGLDLAHAPWVLVLDADERVGGDAERLRTLLAATNADILVAQVHNVYPEEFGGSYSSPGYRLLRRSRVRYHGRVHELPRSLDPRSGGAVDCPADVLRVEHLGYADAAVVRRKAQRNASIARAALGQLRHTDRPDPAALAKLWLDLGRSLVICDRRQDAVDAFAAVRELAPGSSCANEATDALARLLLAAGQDEAVLALAEQLRQAGTDGRYCDWLRAQALAQVGRPGEALELLRGVDLLRDTAGRHLDLGQVLEVRALVAELCGQRREALGCLATAMAGHGRVSGRGALLLELWGPGSLQDLVGLLRRSGDRLGPVAEELAGCGPAGRSAAAALAGAGGSTARPGPPRR